MSFECHSYVTRMYSYVIRMLFVCTRMSFVCHSYYSYVVCMSLLCTRMSSVCHSYVLVCHPYVTRMSLVCTRMSFVCHSYVVLPWTISDRVLFQNTIPSVAATFQKSYFLTTYFFRRVAISLLRFLSTITLTIYQLVIKWAQYKLGTLKLWEFFLVMKVAS